MDNAEEILQALEEFSKLKPKDIPKELDEYLGYVAKTGDPVFQWHLVKYLFHEKLGNVIKDFYETSPTIDLPPCRNVDPFNYEIMRTCLLERLDTFSSAPFTVQRICELLTSPKKQYNRVDKFMRAVEKNILVVSTREPGVGKRIDDQTETVLNGMPESKPNEDGDRLVSVNPDNLQFSNSTEVAQIPVENAVNACVIQEEIEIENSVPALTTTVITAETKGWCGDDEKDVELGSKTDLVDSSEINVGTSSAVLQSTNAELPKNTNIIFADSEDKTDHLDTIKTSPDKVLSNEPVVSTPDSPDSPEPNSENICDENDESEMPETSENETKSSVKEESENSSQLDAEVKESEIENGGDTNQLMVNDSDDTQISTEEVVISQDLQKVDNEGEELSPNCHEPDLSNDSSQNSEDNCLKESAVDNFIENDTIPQSKEVKTNNSELDPETVLSTDIVTTVAAQVSENQEEKTISEEIVKETNGEDNEISHGLSVVENSGKEEEIKCTVIEEAIEETVISEETVLSSCENVSVQEIAEVKEHIEESTADEHSEIVQSSEVVDEICDDQERIEGSIIHATSSISDASDVLTSKKTTAAVEDICEDPNTCNAEDEAMDVDESSNQQMVTSEGENEAEPMDQSDEQLQS